MLAVSVVDTRITLLEIQVTLLAVAVEQVGQEATQQMVLVEMVELVLTLLQLGQVQLELV
jgi:hypothetical protein